MNLKLILMWLPILVISSFQSGSFKEIQQSYPRVKEAYEDKEAGTEKLLKSSGIDPERFNIYLRAFKADQIIELWARNSSSEPFRLIREYQVCAASGLPGPKRKQGDRQVPEGFYHIDRFNPRSNYHLSLGINYPNRSDKILADKEKPGGDIFIHGACATIGCLPITDEWIKELYVFCVEARDLGQSNIPVTIFPVRLTDSKYAELKKRHASDEDKLGLWADLKKGYDYFNETKMLPGIGFLENGRHRVSK